MDRLGRYEIVECLYEAFWGESVYSAQDSRSGEFVTLKVISPALSTELQQMFFHNERETLGTLKHPNIVRLLGSGEEQGLLYLVVEPFEGPNLEKVIADRQLVALPQKLEIAAQVADALQCAHAHGIVHRSLLPLEIILPAGCSVKLHGFHLRHTEEGRHSARAGQIIGKPRYLSPEQLKGRKVDGRSDVFSLGQILYRWLTYAVPFPGANITDIIFKVLNEPPERLSEYLPDAPADLVALVEKALAKSLEERYRSAQAMASDLRAVAQALG